MALTRCPQKPSPAPSNKTFILKGMGGSVSLSAHESLSGQELFWLVTTFYTYPDPTPSRELSIVSDVISMLIRRDSLWMRLKLLNLNDSFRLRSIKKTGKGEWFGPTPPTLASSLIRRASCVPSS